MSVQPLIRILQILNVCTNSSGSLIPSYFKFQYSDFKFSVFGHSKFVTLTVATSVIGLRLDNIHSSRLPVYALQFRLWWFKRLKWHPFWFYPCPSESYKSQPFTNHFAVVCTHFDFIIQSIRQIINIDDK